MSHITCPHCNSNDHLSSYGCGGPFGGLSMYSICDHCDRVLECHMDMEGMEDLGAFQEKVDAMIAAQFVPGGQPIKRKQTIFPGLAISYSNHIPEQPAP